MLHWMLQLFPFVFITFFLSSATLYSLVSRFVAGREDKKLLILAVTAPLGPALVSLLLYYSLLIFPGGSDLGYIASIVIFLVALSWGAVLRPSFWGRLGEVVSSAFHDLSFAEKFFISVLVLLLLSLFILAAVYPVYANDPVQYFLEGKYIYLDKDARLYPFVSYPTGYITHTRHPPFYTMLIVWSYLFTSNPDVTLLGRLMAPWYAVCGAFLFLALFAGKKNVLGVLAALFTFGTPLVYHLVAIAHIDVFRVVTGLAAAVWVWLLLGEERKVTALIVGIAIGFAMRVHASSVLVYPFLMVVYFILSSAAWRKRVWLWAGVTLGAFLVCGPDYLRNIFVYGDILSGTEEVQAVYSLDMMRYGDYVSISREVYTLKDKIVNGVLRGFSSFDFFGLSYVFALFGVFISLRRLRSIEAIFLFQIGLFYCVVVSSVALGMNFIIKNPRYLLMVHPFVAYFAALFTVNAYEKVRSN